MSVPRHARAEGTHEDGCGWAWLLYTQVYEKRLSRSRDFLSGARVTGRRKSRVARPPSRIRAKVYVATASMRGSP